MYLKKKVCVLNLYFCLLQVLQSLKKICEFNVDFHTEGPISSSFGAAYEHFDVLHFGERYLGLRRLGTFVTNTVVPATICHFF